MAISSAVVTVTTAATALNVRSENAIRLTLINGAAVVILGGSAVTATTGPTLAINGALTVELAPGEVLFGIVAAGSTPIGVLRSGT